MTRRLAALAFAIGLPLAAKAPKTAIPVITDEKVDFAAGGAIDVTAYVGQMNIESWDGPGVDITVTRMAFRAGAPANQDAAKKKLDAIKVTTERKSPTALSIRTELPHRGFWARVAHRGRDFQVDYRIRVPRDTKLALRNGTGDVIVHDVAGDIDATVKAGDIVVQLPSAGAYAIDAKCGFGGVYSDFDGDYHTGHLVGERFAQSGAGQARQVRLRVGIGGISIQKIPVATK